jgi:hypothetical protein
MKVRKTQYTDKVRPLYDYEDNGLKVQREWGS